MFQLGSRWWYPFWILGLKVSSTTGSSQILVTVVIFDFKYRNYLRIFFPECLVGVVIFIHFFKRLNKMKLRNVRDNILHVFVQKLWVWLRKAKCSDIRNLVIFSEIITVIHYGGVIFSIFSNPEWNYRINITYIFFLKIYTFTALKKLLYYMEWRS